MFNCKFQSIFYGFSNCSMLAGIMDYFGALILELLTVFAKWHILVMEITWVVLCLTDALFLVRKVQNAQYLMSLHMDMLIQHIPQLFLEVASVSLIISLAKFASASKGTGLACTKNAKQMFAQWLFLLLKAVRRGTEWMPEEENWGWGHFQADFSQCPPKRCGKNGHSLSLASGWNWTDERQTSTLPHSYFEGGLSKSTSEGMRFI